MRGYIDGTISGDGDMPNNPTQAQILYYRMHPIMQKRRKQLTINQLGMRGGRPYVNARLSRFAAETQIDWIGGTRPDGSAATGRLQQTHAFPYLGRIAAKFNQYVFGTNPTREGANEDVLKDITRSGRNINTVMRTVSDYLLSSNWCWIGIDAPSRKGDGTEYSITEKESLKIRPYWQVYGPNEVMDWHFNERGELEWIKTKHIVYDGSNPATKPETKQVVKLWEKGKVTEFSKAKGENGKETITKQEYTLSLTDRVPFVLCGELSAEPIAFDDLESINRSIMDLGSVDRANFFNVSYPQLVLPASVLTNAVNAGYAANATEAGKLIVGFKNPILADKDDADSKYLMPDAGSMLSIGERIDTLKSDMFEVVGLALEQSSRQVESAESKAWDNLDVAAVMRSRAEILEDAERKAVEICKAWDSSFNEWTPVYNRDFDIGNFKDEINALIVAGNMPAPASVTREVVRKLVDRLDRIGAPIDSDLREKIMGDIDTWNPNDFGTPPAV